MPQGIILAAGTSSRAQTNKMLLRHHGLFLIEHAINGMAPFVSVIYVVTGHYHEEIENVVGHYPKVKIVHNPDYNDGMFSSVLTGARACSDDFLLLPGDCPFVTSETYQSLLSGHQDIRVPSHDGRLGHPLFMNNNVRAKLIQEPLDGNLKVFRNRHGYAAIEVDDANIFIDIDTLEDFRKL